VILNTQPNQGQALIEKFEYNASDAAFAVILLTGDDEGGPRGSTKRQRRARQNVVFELGFFIALLGRSRVCILYESGVELPSDIHGIVYTELDQLAGGGSGWRASSARPIYRSTSTTRSDDPSCDHWTTIPIPDNLQKRFVGGVVVSWRSGPSGLPGGMMT
jgi:hypothetical protein